MPRIRIVIFSSLFFAFTFGIIGLSEVICHILGTPGECFYNAETKYQLFVLGIGLVMWFLDSDNLTVRIENRLKEKSNS